MPGLGHLFELEVPVPGVPENKFILAPNDAPKLQTDLSPLGVHAESLEGDFDLDRPSLLVLMRSDLPHLVPLHIHFIAFINDQGIVLGA